MTFSTELSLEWVLSAAGVIAGFLLGFWQYVRSQRQEKVTLLLPLITEFETDPELQAACQLFDYDAGTFTLHGNSYTFTNSDLLSAMKVVEWDSEWPPLHQAIRDVLDRYFDYFGKLQSFVDIRLLAFSELKYFYYYLELLAGIEKYKGKGFHDALDRYLGGYHFVGCRKCLNQYCELPPTKRSELVLVDPLACAPARPADSSR